MPSPRADGSTSNSRSFATRSDFLTRNTDPTMPPSRSAIQQTLALGIEVLNELRGNLRHQCLESLIPSVFVRVQYAMTVNDPSHVAGLMRSQQVRAPWTLAVSEHFLDRHHRAGQTILVAGR